MTSYNGQSDPRLQAIAEAERQRFRSGNGHSNDHAATAAPLWGTCQLDAWARTGQLIPERKWIMEDWIPRGQTTGLYGVSGVLKTTFLLQLMMAASAGLAFCGLLIMQVPVYGLFCEDTKDEVLRRIQRIAKFYQRASQPLSRFPLRFPSRPNGQRIVALRPRQAPFRPGLPAIHTRDRKYRPGLVVLDTLPDFFGGEEINRRQTSQFIRMLDGIGMQHNCAIVCAAHPSLRGRASGRLDSGNTGIEGKMRARLTLHDPGDEVEEDETREERAYRIAVNPTDKRILTRVNSNYAKPGATIELVIRDGVFHPAAIDPEETKKRGPHRATRRSKTCFSISSPRSSARAAMSTIRACIPPFMHRGCLLRTRSTGNSVPVQGHSSGQWWNCWRQEKSDWKQSVHPVDRIANSSSATNPKGGSPVRFFIVSACSQLVVDLFQQKFVPVCALSPRG